MAASFDWWALTAALLRMDTATTLFANTLAPAIAGCASFAELHALQSGLAAVLGSEHVARFPLRPSYVYSLLKLVVAASEAAGKRLEQRAGPSASSNGDDNEAEEDTSPVADDLFEIYLEFATAGALGGASTDSVDKSEAATFFTALLTAPFGGGLGAPSVSSSEERGGEVFSAPTFAADPHVMGRFAPMRVTSAFVNVGLAVWPAAHITIDLLATLAEMGAAVDGVGAEDEVPPARRLAGWFPSAPHAMLESLKRLHAPQRGGSSNSGEGGSEGCKEPLRILELGAGVGLTPAVLHKRYAYAVPSAAANLAVAVPAMALTVTDYQPIILDNCAHNLALNGCSFAQYRDAKTMAAGDATEKSGDIGCGADKRSSSSLPPAPKVEALIAPLDWNEREETRLLVRAARPHIAVAADCIYDRCVLEGLSETLRDAMTVDLAPPEEVSPASSSFTPRLVVNNGCVSVIIQTHRNDATQTELHDKLRSFANVFSFHYDAAGHRLVPLEASSSGCCGWRAGAKAVANPTEAQCIPLLRCGDWRVEMSDIMYVHFLWMRDSSE